MTERLSDRGGSALAALRTRNYRLWFFGLLISQAGVWVQFVAQALLVLDLTNSGALLGVVVAMQFLPVLVVGPWAGLVSDRVDKRRVLLATNTVMMLSALVLGVVVIAGAGTYLVVLILATVSGTANAFDQPARRTIVTELVDEEMEASAIATSNVINNTAKVVGPAIGGAVVAWLGHGWCFLFNGVTSLAALAALLLLDASQMRTPKRPPARDGQIKEGFRYVWERPHLRRPLLLISAVSVVGMNWNVLLPLLVTRDLDGGAGGVAFAFGMMGVGSIVGSLQQARRPRTTNQFLSVSCISFGIALVVLSASGGVYMLSGASFVVGVTSMLMYGAAVIGLQIESAPAVRGRVMAMFIMVFYGSFGIGGPATGWLAEQIGARPTMCAGGVIALALGGLSLTTGRARRTLAPSVVRMTANAADAGHPR